MHYSLDHLLRSYSNAIGNRSFQRLSKFADRIYWPDITPSKLTFIASYTPSHICTGRVLHEHSMSIVPALLALHLYLPVFVDWTRSAIL